MKADYLFTIRGDEIPKGRNPGEVCVDIHRNESVILEVQSGFPVLQEDKRYFLVK